MSPALPPLLFAVNLFVGQPSATPPPPQAGAVVQPKVETTDSPAFQIGLTLRCPVCQGMPIAESPSQMAQDMMVKVREMVAAGKTEQEIYDYFVERYGEWVLLKPKAEGFNLGLWILPVVALLVGGLLVWRFVKQSSALPDAAPAFADGDDTGDDAEPTDEAVKDDAPDDEYLAAVREEVRR